MPRRATEVEQVVRAWLGDKQAARAANIEQRLADYDGALAIGTERDEWWSGSEAFRSAHVSGGEFSATIEDLEAHREGQVAWAAARAVIDTGGPERLVIRLTLVLVRDDGAWRIVQSHASTPEATSPG
jgi:ketosteroid isomerase-like protein